jgi:hypothetical protein
VHTEEDPRERARQLFVVSSIRRYTRSKKALSYAMRLRQLMLIATGVVATQGVIREGEKQLLRQCGKKKY